MTTLIDAIKTENNYTVTENGAVTHKSTLSATLDYFGLGSALRERTEADIINLFKKAFEEDPLIAMKALFHSRNIRGGQGERNSFRIIFKWLAINHSNIAVSNIGNVIEMGRWDDLFVLKDTPIWKTYILPFIESFYFSEEDTGLFFKWIPSINCSSKESKKLAHEIANYCGVTHREYRKRLSLKRAELNVVEKKMCNNEWDKIDYSHVPSRASLLYKKAFEKHDPIGYAEFIKKVEKGEAKINANTLYPYDIVRNAFNDNNATNDVLWKALPDYTDGDKSNSLVVVDTSGSMTSNNSLPLYTSISLGMYIAERNKGIFNNHIITFHDTPELISIKGTTLFERIQNIRQIPWGGSTNLQKTFDLILDSAIRHKVSEEDMPKRLYIISDMEFNQCERFNNNYSNFDFIKQKYIDSGYVIPELVFWNVNARNTQTPIIKNDKGVCLVSGSSPSILKTLLSGKISDPVQVMIDTLNDKVYDSVVI